MNQATPQPIPSGWLEVIEESDAQLGAEKVVPLSLILAELQDTITHIEAKLATDPAALKANSTPPKP